MTTAVVFVVAFLLGYGTSVRIVNRDRSEAPASRDAAAVGSAGVSAAADPSSLTESQGIDSIVADDQSAGDAVAVSVKTEKEAWAVIHEDAAGKPGNILGAQIFPAGEHLGKIELLRGTEAGKKYYAMLHADDGDRAFDYALDVPIKNAGGEPMMDAFTVGTATSVQ